MSYRGDSRTTMPAQQSFVDDIKRHQEKLYEDICNRLTLLSEEQVLSQKDENKVCSFCNLLSDLSNDFQSLLRRGLFTDAEIKCGSEVLKVHKSVLCTRSTVFEAMFNNSMQERENDSVVIEDINPAVLNILITFLYSGQVKKNLNVSTACDLFHAAEKYQISALKNVCTQYLKSHLSRENALQILQCANLYDEKLKKEALVYVTKNFTELRKAEEWKKLQSCNAVLAFEVFSSAIDALEKKE